MTTSIGSLSGFFDGFQFHEGPISVYIENNRISDIVHEEDRTTEIDGSGKILTPTFVDGHTHLIFGGTRFFELSMKLAGNSYSEILEKGGGIQHTVKMTRQTSDEVLLENVLNRCDVMLQNGCGMIEAKSGYGLNFEQEIRLLKILNEANKRHPIEIVPTFGGPHVFPKDISRESYIESIVDEMIPYIAENNLATTTDVFCDQGAFSVEEATTIFEASLKHNIPIRVHAEELEYTGIGKIAAEEYNAISVDHLLHAKKSDFEIYSDNNTVAMFMPMAPISLFTDQKPEGFDETQVIIGIGSDFNPNNWVLSLQTAMRIGVFTYRMNPTDIIRSATSGSFKGVTGNNFSVLQKGSVANVLLINAQSPSELVSKFGQNLVNRVILNGNTEFTNEMNVA